MMVTVLGDVEGREVRAVTIRGGDLSATIMEWGCVMQDLRHLSVDRNLILSHPSLADYVAQGREHVGAIAGRCANRIRGGRFVIDGIAHEVARNVMGRDTLHGGDRGFGRSLWHLADHGPDHATFTIRQAHGHEGFPGTIEATCQYRLTQSGLEMVMTATTDAPTICNLAQHNYYNLSGAPVIDDHVLAVASNRHTPLAADMAPTGAILPNRGAVDLAGGRRVGPDAIDLNYILADDRQPTPRPAARLTAGDVALTVATTEPGLQVYTGDHLPGRARAGICLEAQVWPDAANQPHFPSALLRPGQTYRQVTVIGIDRV